MHKILIVVAVLAWLNDVGAQDWKRDKVNYGGVLAAGEELRLIIDAKTHPHVSYFLEAEPELMRRLQWRTSLAMDWSSISIDEHLSSGERYFSRLQFAFKDHIDTLYLRSLTEKEGAVFFHQFHPGQYSSSHASDVDLREGDCACPAPDWAERLDWCATCPTSSMPVLHEPTHLIVHHSAGVNSSADWSAVVRSIWDFHVNGRGWSDIGYHYLIDPNGVVYLGRRDNIQGAHFCSRNSGAVGICMLGTFTQERPAESARQAWIDLAAYSSCTWSIAPQMRSLHISSGLDLFGVSGHRDGCATECPGQALYNELPTWRSALQDQIETCLPEKDSLMLTVSGTAFPFTIDLDWSGGDEGITQYRIHLRALNTGPLSGRVIAISGEVETYRLSLSSETKYEIQIEAWKADEKLQTSNRVYWTTEAWPSIDNKMLLTPNPVIGNDVQWVWTDDYRGDFELAWINMSGQTFTVLKGRKTRDTYLTRLLTRSLPAGLYYLQVSYGERVAYVSCLIL